MKYIVFILSLVLGTILNAQGDSLKVSVSEIFKNEKYETTLLFAKEDSEGDIFIVRNYYSSIAKPKGYYIEHYNKDLKLQKRTTVEVNRSDIKGLFLTKDSVILLQFQYNYKEKKYAFVTLSSPKAAFDFTEKEIYSIDRNRLSKYDRFGIRNDPEFNLHSKNNLGEIVESKNEGFFAINLFTKKKEADALLVITFNKNFEKIYEYEFENIISKKGNDEKLPLEYQNMVLDNNGAVYFLGRIFNSQSEKLAKNDVPDYYFVLFRADKALKKQEIVSIQSDNIIRSLRLAINADKLVAVGFYTTTTKTGFFDLNTGLRFDGVVRVDFDPHTLENLSESFQPFSEEFMAEKYGKVKEKIKSYLSYRNIFMLENGDVIINAEEFEMPLIDDFTLANRIYRDILAIRISNNGEISWAKNIIKKQNALSLNNISYLSYASTVKNGISYYLVNADAELKELKNERIKLNEGKRLYVFQVPEIGLLQYNRPIYTNIFNAHLRLRFSVPINESDLLMEAESEGKPVMVKFYF